MSSEPNTQEGAKMERTWTPEPWRAEWQPGQTPKHTYTHCVMYGDESLCDTLTEADANRIIACVNALAGVADPAEFVREAKEYERHAKNVYQDSCEGAYIEVSYCDAMRQALAEVAPEHPALKGGPPNFGTWESLARDNATLRTQVADLTAQRDAMVEALSEMVKSARASGAKIGYDSRTFDMANAAIALCQRPPACKNGDAQV